MIYWMKYTLRSVDSEKGECPIPPINASWSTPDEMVYMLHIQAIWTWLHDSWGIQVMVNSAVKWGSFALTSTVTLLLQYHVTVREALSNLLSQLPLMSLTHANNNTR